MGNNTNNNTPTGYIPKSFKTTYTPGQGVPPSQLTNDPARPASLTKKDNKSNNLDPKQSFSEKYKNSIKKEDERIKNKNYAKGFNKITKLINDTISTVRSKIDDFYFGKPKDENKKFPNPLTYGLVNLLNLIISVDLCAIFNYALNQVPGGKKFDPNDKSESKTTLGNIKYQVQYAAYEIQTLIDNYYGSYGDKKNSVSKTALGKLISEISQALSVLVGPESQQILKDPELTKAFPNISLMDNFMQQALTKFNKYTDINSLNALVPEEINKIISYIDKTRTTCVAMQSLRSPKDLLAFADTFANDALAKQISELNKIIDPKKITPVIKSISDTCRKIQNICNQILSYINLAKSVISIAVLLIKIFKIIERFLLFLAIPALYTTAGMNVTFSKIRQGLADFIENLLKRLSEINVILENLYYFVQDLSIKIENIIMLIDLVVVNLENCNNLDPEIVKELKAVNKDLQSTKESLDEFVKIYESNKEKKNTTFGEYSIKILTEQLTDEGIALKRRYGVALDNRQVEVVKSTLTFASDDNIIIQEVKLLLISKNLVKLKVDITTADELAILEESLNYITNDINFEIDSSSNATIDDTLGINSFVDNLKGGKKLRNNMKKMLQKQKSELSSSLSKTDSTRKIKKK